MDNTKHPALRTDSGATLTRNGVEPDEADGGAQDDRANIVANALPKEMAIVQNTQEDERNDSPQDPIPRRSSTSRPIDPRSTPFRSASTTVINLISTTASASAFPESFGLYVSACGRYTVAYSSSALYILSTMSLPHYDQCKAFRLRRKPVAVAFVETGLLAILTTSHKIDVYQIGDNTGSPLVGEVVKLATVWLDIEARTVALTEDGSVVAAGGDGSIELKNIGPGSEHLDKRQINCSSIDHISFSPDSRSVLLTAAARKARTSTFISINSAFEDAMFEDVQELEPLGKMWISRLLFPDKINARQAAFLPDRSVGHIDHILAFDAHGDRFAIYDVTNKKFTNKVFGIPEDFRLSRTERFSDCGPSIMPDSSHVAVTLQMIQSPEIWVYHLPPDWIDQVLEETNPEVEGSRRSKVRPCIRLFVPPRGDGMPSTESLSSIHWVKDPTGVRKTTKLVALINTAAVVMPEDVVPSATPPPGGKLLIFDLAQNDSMQTTDISEPIDLDLDAIEVSDDLSDEQLEIDQEIDLVRRRTTRMQTRPPNAVITGSGAPREPRRSLSSGSFTRSSALLGLHDLGDSTGSNDGRRPRRRRSLSSLSSMSERESEDASPALIAADEPYVPFQPRSQFTIQRAATMMANSVAARTHLRALPDRPLEYRRADGLREMPHESDADNWVAPPPLYTAKPGEAETLLAGQPISVVPPMPPLPTSFVSRPVITINSPARDQHPGLFAPVNDPSLSAAGSSAVRSRALPQQRVVPAPALATYVPQGIRSPSITHPPTAEYTIPSSPRPQPPSLVTSIPGSMSTPASPAVHRLTESPANIPQSATATIYPSMSNLPTAEQLNSLHRRSISGNSTRLATRAALAGRDAARRQSVETDLNYNIMRSAMGSDTTQSNQTTVSPSHLAAAEPRIRSRPAPNRLATIASVVSHTSTHPDTSSLYDNPTPQPIIMSHSRASNDLTPTTTRGDQTSIATVGRRKSWWRSKSANDARVSVHASHVSLPLHLASVGEMGESEMNGGNEGRRVNGNAARQRSRLSRRVSVVSQGRRASDPVALREVEGSAKGKGKGKEDKGVKCVVM